VCSVGRMCVEHCWNVSVERWNNVCGTLVECECGALVERECGVLVGSECGALLGRESAALV